MPKVYQCPEHQVLVAWTDALMNVLDSLNDWEQVFVKSIKEQLRHKPTLSRTQADKLETLYAEKTK